jgi:hypothetical protein
MSSVERVVQQLRAAQESIEQAVGRVDGARRDVWYAIAQLRNAIGGATKPDAQAGPERWEAAHNHLNRMVGRLLTGSRRIDDYIEHISPDSATRATSLDGSTPSPLDSAGGGRQDALAALRDITLRQVGDLQDASAQISTTIHRGVALARRRPVTPSTEAPAIHPHAPPPMDPADLVSQLIVAVAVTVIGVQRFTQSRGRRGTNRRKGANHGE